MIPIVGEEIENYARKYTKSEPHLLKELIAETYATQALPHMLTGRLEGRLLNMLVRVSNAVEVLELGMFTGYSSLSMAEALPNHGRLITSEIAEKPAVVARKYFARSSHGYKITIKMQSALEVIEGIKHELDFVFIDADKANYLNYFNTVLPKIKVGGLIVFDNTLWSGRVINPLNKSDRAIHELNVAIADSSNVENVILTVRDGINVVRKVGSAGSAMV